MNSVAKRLSPANLIAMIALVLALGGTAYAALGRNSVKAKHIAPGAVRAEELGKVVVRSNVAALADGSNAAPFAKCDPDERVIGGGGRIYGSGDDLAMEASHPIGSEGVAVPSEGAPADDIRGWQAFFHNTAGGQGATAAAVYVLCLQ